MLGSRRQLPIDSPLRDRRCGLYHFIGEERRGPAKLRTTALMHNCLRLLQEDNLQHVCGFSGTPMFHKRVGFDYVLDTVPEPMHLFPRIFLFYANILCGGIGQSTRAKSWRDKKMDVKHREECERLNIFPEVWTGHMHRLSDSVRAVLLTPTDADIARMPRRNLELWLHKVGETTSGLLVGDLRRRIMRIRVQLRQPGDFLFRPRNPTHLPWRLTATGFQQVDKRIKSLVFPLCTERVLKNGKSFLQSSAATSKSAKKHLMLLRILPTVLRGFVKGVRRGLRFLVLGWRLLDGQVNSFNQCVRLGIEPGGKSLDPQVIQTAGTLIVKGIAMTTGAVPPSTLIPYLHILSHYGDDSETFGILSWCVVSCIHAHIAPYTCVSLAGTRCSCLRCTIGTSKDCASIGKKYLILFPSVTPHAPPPFHLDTGRWNLFQTHTYVRPERCSRPSGTVHRQILT